jgi:hypothetical protein
MRHRRGRTRVTRLLAIPAAAALLGGLAVFGSGQAQASPRAGSGGWQFQATVSYPATTVRPQTGTSGLVAAGGTSIRTPPDWTADGV